MASQNFKRVYLGTIIIEPQLMYSAKMLTSFLRTGRVTSRKHDIREKGKVNPKGREKQAILSLPRIKSKQDAIEE